MNVYVLPEKKERWAQAALKRGYVRRFRKEGSNLTPNLSDFVESVVDETITGKRQDRVSQSEINQLRAKIASLEQDKKALELQITELKNRTAGVSEDRIIAILSSGKVVQRHEISAHLIKTEDDAAYETLQRLMEKGIVKYVATRGGWGYKLNQEALKKQEER